MANDQQIICTDLDQRFRNFTMKQPNLESYRLKVKLTLSLPDNRLRSKIAEGFSDMELPERSCSQKTSSSQSSDMSKGIFMQKYAIEQTLGQGAHGVVKACVLKSKNQKFAVKIMKLDEQISYMYRKNFLTMKCLRHENIIKYKALYLDKVKKMSYLVMNHIPYPTLKGVKVENQEELKHIAAQIVRALKYMHKKHICHRDLKTQNILYSREEKKLSIIDFGICKKMTIRNQKTQMLTPTGTLIYKAPQMFQGGGYDQKIDLWALGVIMYELVTGKNPFVSEYMSDTIRNIQNKEIDFSDECWSGYSKVCKDLISHLLKKNRKDRLNTEETKNHLFFFEKNMEGMNLSHRQHREKTEKKIAEEYLQTYIIPNPRKQKKYSSDFSEKKTQLIAFVDSQEEDSGINIY